MRACPAVLSPHDEDKLRSGSPEDFQRYEQLLKKLDETGQAHERQLKKIIETEEAYDKACANIDKFTHQMRVILKQMTLFG